MDPRGPPAALPLGSAVAIMRTKGRDRKASADSEDLSVGHSGGKGGVLETQGTREAAC